jgi:hypothetical protein
LPSILGEPGGSLADSLPVLVGDGSPVVGCARVSVLMPQPEQSRPLSYWTAVRRAASQAAAEYASEQHRGAVTSRPINPSLTLVAQNMDLIRVGSLLNIRAAQRLGSNHTQPDSVL